MSSLAAVQADGYYIDPLKFDHKKRGRDSANAIAQSNPLRKRMKSEGVLVVRFEMPHNVWCGGCERHIARGVRFNAEKKASGKYLSTTILEFSMKCPSCPMIFKIKTDPKNADYEFIEGCRKQATAGSDPVDDNDDEESELSIMNDIATGSSSSSSTAAKSTMMIQQRRERKKTDALFRLECETEDRLIAARENERLIAIADAQEARYGADRLLANGAARRIVRESRKESSVRALEGAAMGLEGIELLPVTEQDFETAAKVMKERKRSSLTIEDGTLKGEINQDSEDIGGGGGIKRSLNATSTAALLSSSIFPTDLIKGKEHHHHHHSLQTTQPLLSLKNQQERKNASRHSSQKSSFSSSSSLSLSKSHTSSSSAIAPTPSISSIVREGLLKAREEKNAIAKRVENAARFGGRNIGERGRGGGGQGIDRSKSSGLSLTFK